jgi:hypothetical protein
MADNFVSHAILHCWVLITECRLSGKGGKMNQMGTIETSYWSKKVTSASKPFSNTNKVSE